MSKLALNIGIGTSPIALDTALDVGSYPAPFLIDDEAILVTGGDGSRTVSVLRGQNGTAIATHTAGTDLVEGWYTGGGGGGTLEETLALGNTTGEHTIVMPSGRIDGTAGNGEIDIHGTDVGGVNGGNVFIASASGTDAGAASIGGGHAAAGTGGNVNADGATATTTGGVQLYGGTATLSTDADGGDITLTPGAGDGAGRHGLIFANLPTSDPGVVGALWVDAVTHIVKVSA